MAVRRQSLILFGSRDPEQVATGPSLVMQSNVPFSPMSAATPASAKLQHQKQTLNLMNKKLQRTLESGAIVNSPSSSASRTVSPSTSYMLHGILVLIIYLPRSCCSHLLGISRFHQFSNQSKKFHDTKYSNPIESYEYSSKFCGCF